MPIITQPHLGYYTVGNTSFRNPTHAFLYATKTNQEVSWTFNDVQYSNHNWAIEPEESLDTLYQLRAKEIREKYDYVAILYSAGSDSNNILMSFLNQGLHVDEVINGHNFEAGKNIKTIDRNDKSVSNAVIAEYELQAIPRLQEIKNNHPEIKLSVLDFTEHIVSRFTNIGDASWIETGNGFLSPAGGSRWDISRIPEFRKTLETGKKICYILGCDKPRCGFTDDQWFIAFNDKPTNQGPDHGHLKDFPNSNLEFFYWGNTEISLRMLTKQSFVIKRYVEGRPELWPYFQFPLTKEKIIKIHEPLLRQLLYSTWHESEYYQADKPMHDWTMEYDDWFFQQPEFQRAKDIWADGIKHVVNNANRFVEYDNGVPDGFKKFFKKYSAGTFNRKLI